MKPASSHLTGKRILITGAGGSIGYALAIAIADLHPASLILLDASEHASFQADRNLSHAPHISILGSVCDTSLLVEIFELYRPEIIFHAAAFKHVPLLEQNPFAAIANNALGTYTLLQAALTYRAEHLILVSTDKAVNPISLMGASKRIAELVLLALATDTTRTTAIRLGNVLGSRGSVVPLFLGQIRRGGPVTVTHPEVTRYFMSLDEATFAILSASVLRARGTILIPDLAPPIRIADLARDLITQQSSRATIVFTQLRPGDKLEESLISHRECHLPGPQAPGLYAIDSPTPTAATLHAAMQGLQQSIANRDPEALFNSILQLVPEYTPAHPLLRSPALQGTSA